MAEELRALNVNVDWKIFGDATERDIDYLFQEYNLNAEQRIIVRSLWKNHPKQITGVETYPIERLLRQLRNIPGFEINARVIDEIKRSSSLTTRCSNCQTPQEAYEIYCDGELIPKSETRAALLANANIAIDGEFNVPGVQNARFFRAFEHYRFPKILKIPNQPTIIDDEVKMYNQLRDEGIGNIPLVPVEKLSCEIEYNNYKSPAKTIRAGILMPLYPYTMHDLPSSITSDRALEIISRISIAIDFINAHRWMHGDVKGQNIFMDVDGNAYLGDYGSSCSYDKLATFHGGTLIYQCADIVAKDYPVLFDKIGLAISILKQISTEYERHGVWYYDELLKETQVKCNDKLLEAMMQLISK